MAEEKQINNTATVIDNIKREIKKIEDKEFTIFFFVFDTKGAPNGELSYIYNTAYELMELGYNVRMLQSESDFVGVTGWMGEKYGKLQHYNTDKDGVKLNPSDLLIIPEIFSNVMYKTSVEDAAKGLKKAPCKRIMLLNNYSYFIDTIQPGATPEMYGIRDCICSNNNLKNKMNTLFPNIKTSVVSNFVDDMFFSTDYTFKKPVINIITKDRNVVKRITNEFFWRFPAYKWVAFSPLANLTMEEYAGALKDSVATIWVDNDTDFGVSALEAMASGNVIIGKIPETDPEWMVNEEGNIKENGVWCYDLNAIPDIIANIIQSYLHNNIPAELYKSCNDTASMYTKDKFVDSIKEVYGGIMESRKNEMETALKVIEKK